ncbi:threonine-phosphate decarboxylase [Leptolyngbya sp. Heron Island J]|uniref:threonine-phosphate decarboxylase CobD n=1 Tax=Leptolyngbya sp. Heron Island J TaxID=1385935 RepID=UPI0003B93F92|nr:threonine-phosphate decarboxylase CobD [Leptolyngbya sp. Heron Island J]ESA38694.1 threonine-phosphate decarboxylase [Leptolyngbya sp. Heron Island J]
MVTSPSLSGSYRPTHGGNRNWAAQLVDCKPEEILDFSASINPLGPPQSVLTELTTHLQNLTAYPDPNYVQLRLALSNVHNLPMDWILPGNGAAELLTWIGRELAQLEATYLVTPAFADYQRSLKAFKAKVIPLPMDLATVPPQPTITASANCGLLLNNPHNPTGALTQREEIVPYLEQFALVVVDEAFMDFLPLDQQQSVLDLVLDCPNLIVLRSLTKFYSLPGLRLGYAIGHPDHLQRWQRWRDPWPVNTLAEVAAIAALKDRPFQQKTWNWLPPSRDALIAGLQKLPGLTPLPSAANFLLVKTEIPSPQLQRDLLKAHQILIRDCLSFPELGENYFRVAVRLPKENDQLLAALAQALTP